MQVISVCPTGPIRAELEFKGFGRDYFVNDWDTAKGNVVVSVPVEIFIDGFGLYRNRYHPLMGKKALVMQLCIITYE